MKYLLDTCTFIWAATNSDFLSPSAIELLSDVANDGFLSVVSLWEISMKSVAGKLPNASTPNELQTLATAAGLSVLPLSVAHVHKFHFLPLVHRDPFDRLLASIALDEGCVMLSPDTAFDSLGVTRLW